MITIGHSAAATDGCFAVDGDFEVWFLPCLNDLEICRDDLVSPYQVLPKGF